MTTTLSTTRPDTTKENGEENMHRGEIKANKSEELAFSILQKMYVEKRTKNAVSGGAVELQSLSDNARPAWCEHGK